MKRRRNSNERLFNTADFALLIAGAHWAGLNNGNSINHKVITRSIN